MLGEAVEGTNNAFIERMNATAAKLGMTRTRFMNANGLPHEDQVTTARDLARLASAVVRTRKSPLPLSEPLITAMPGWPSTGNASPVIAAVLRSE